MADSKGVRKSKPPKILEEFFSLALFMCFLGIIGLSVLNPLELPVTIVWEVAALLITACVVVVIALDSIAVGSNKLWDCIKIRQSMMIGATYVFLTLVLLLSLLIAAEVEILMGYLRAIQIGTSSLYDYRLTLHSIIIFLGSLATVLVSIIVSRIEINPDLQDDFIRKHRPVVEAEKKHARLSLVFIDIPTALGLGVFTILIYWEQRSFMLGNVSSAPVLEVFLSGAVAITLLIANFAYLITRYKVNTI